MSGAEFLRDLLDEDRYTGPLPKGTREAIAEVLEEREQLLNRVAATVRGAQRMRCPEHSTDASNAWGCPVCVYELRQQVAALAGKARP